MVSLPALLAEAPHIPYKLQLSLESCDFPPPPPAPHSFSDMKGRYGCRYEGTGMKTFVQYFMSSFIWHVLRWLAVMPWPLTPPPPPPAAVTSKGHQRESLWALSATSRHRMVHLRISAVMIGTWQVDRTALILNGSCAVDLLRDRRVHLCSVWTRFIKRVCHTYRPS